MIFDSLACVCCSLFCYVFISYSTRIILNLAIRKKLFALSNHRSSHVSNVTNLGGIPIFIGIVASIFFSDIIFDNTYFNRILVPLIMLFFVGIKDDLIAMEPFPKLVVQILASLITILLYDLEIWSVNYFLLPVLNSVGSVVLTLLFFVMMINSYNLIDGIDGLAGLAAMTVAVICASASLLNNDPSMLMISLCLLFTIAAFLRFNFSYRRKVFMGDTGSLVVGFLLAFMVLAAIKRSIEMKYLHSGLLSNMIPTALSGILFLQIFDTLRVMSIRIFKLGVSPFKADRNHLHHRLVDRGLTHIQAAIIITVVNIFMGMLFIILNIDFHYLFVMPMFILILLVGYRLFKIIALL